MAYRLVCFDLDGTLIENTTFIWKTLHERLDTDCDAREEAKDAYFAGKLSYHDWAVHDAQLWVDKDVTKADILKALSHLELMKGARETLELLKAKGMKLAIISGSVNTAIEKVLPDYQDIFDDVYVNRLEYDEQGKLTGITPTRYDFVHKATALREIAEREGIPLSETVFVGDHDNDVEVAKTAGFSVAFNCKSDKLREAANVAIKEKDVRLILKYIS